jgi:EmrB/QacA subfamily drug resistance transporter
MGGLMLALFVASLDQTVVGTAIPRIVADLGGFDRFTWITSAYIVASTTAVPIVGRLSDMYGRKVFYIGGIVVFLVGSVLSGFSQSMNQLIAFRAIQGLGGGTMMALAFVTVGDLFPPADRGKYQGFVAAVFGLSSVIGPTLGGFITDTLSWNWIFFINLPIGIPVAILFVLFFPSGRQNVASRRLDVLGMSLLVLSVSSLLIALSWGGVQYAWASVQVVGLLIIAVASTTTFVFVELRIENPIMPMGIYRDRVVGLSLIAVFCTGFGMFGGIVFIPRGCLVRRLRALAAS